MKVLRLAFAIALIFAGFSKFRPRIKLEVEVHGGNLFN